HPSDEIHRISRWDFQPSPLSLGRRPLAKTQSSQRKTRFLPAHRQKRRVVNSRAMRILSGVQASGRLHLGNYYGAIRQFIELQHEGESLYFIANLHAMTTVRARGALEEHTFEAAVAFLALGLDPNKAILFRQSDVPEILELYWILGTLVPLSHLERAHSYKDKIARGI